MLADNPQLRAFLVWNVSEGRVVPSKFYSSIAAGRAVIFIGAYLALAMARSPAMWRAARAA